MLSVLGAASAQAAPSLHCEASPLRATLGGTQSIEPVSQGRGAACATGEAVPSLNTPVLTASALTAKTSFDAATPAGAATGGVANLQVLPTPDLINQLPTEQAIAALPESISVPLPLALSILVAPFGVPPSIEVRPRDAVRALVPSPGTALLSAAVLEARANVTCQAGAPGLSGSSTVTGVKLLGQDIGVDGIVSQALTLIDSQHISLAGLNLTQLHTVTPLDTLTAPLLAQVQAAVQSALAALPVSSITLPASVIDVKLTPNEQTRDGASLTQHALHASLALAGQPVLDAVLGEARVAADDGACPKPPAPGAPAPAPIAAPAKAPAKGGAGAQGVADQLLACSDRKLVLVDVLKQDGHVKLLGAADKKYVGKKVAIRLRRGNRIVAHATVKKDGSFATTAPMPPRAVMASNTKANTLRYRAEIGKELSLPLKLQRRLIVNSLTSKNGKVTISGRVVRPLTTPVSTIRLVRRVSCHKVVLVKRFKPNADGTFRVTVKAPKGQAAAVYRMATSVREKPSNPRSYPTFTLPRGVALNTR